ncbi:docking 5-like [Octopus vulgaris]|uniref:Docking 5-like n=1 Tax=Octopus vulgaris TaxID=6645 RepID=A0AA36BRL6_OCTVU|nr:docking 5-like [Octopus vulgaris]
MCSGAGIKTGIVSVTKVAFFKSKAWVMRRCTLYDKSNNSPAILEIGEDSKSKDANKKSYLLENLQSIHMGIFKSKSYQVMIRSKSFKLLFLVETEEEADSWVRHLKEVSIWEDTKKKKNRSASPDARSSVTDDSDFESCDNSDIYESYEATYFDVEVIKSDVSVRCNISGPYSMLLSKTGISLLNKNRQITYFEWPYRYIRRYGKTANSFTFEAGRKCQSGEGNFQFKTSPGQGQVIFDNVALLVSLIKPIHNDVSTPRSPDVRTLCYKEELERVISNQANPKSMLNKTGKLEAEFSNSDENVHESVPMPLNKNTTSGYSNISKDENEYSQLDLQYEVVPIVDKKLVEADNDYETFEENTKTNLNENEYECLSVSTLQDNNAFKMYDHLNFHNMSKEGPEANNEKFKTWDYETLNNAKKHSEELESQYSELMSFNNCSEPVRDSTVAAQQPKTAQKPEVKPVSISDYQVCQYKQN